MLLDVSPATITAAAEVAVGRVYFNLIRHDALVQPVDEVDAAHVVIQIISYFILQNECQQ